MRLSIWSFIYLTWCLPQTFIGMILLCIFNRLKMLDIKKKCMYQYDVIVHAFKNFSGGISLGKFVFISGDERVCGNILQHERGHSIQSLILGPSYLLVIGIPSFVWATIKVLGFFKKISYYSFYTETWADKLGGVKR